MSFKRRAGAAIGAGVSRREFLGSVAGGAALALVDPVRAAMAAADSSASSDLFWVRNIPSLPFAGGGNRHVGVDALLELMGANGLKFHRTPGDGPTAGPLGLIARDDVVLVKVNAQWKYRGCTNSDVVRGLIQAVLDHPEGFGGEVVIVENGQGRGSLACDTSHAYDGDASVRANAINRHHSFTWLVDTCFADPRVSSRLLDPIREVFIGPDDHGTEGYRKFLRVSYPCFTTAGGRRVELREGIWDGNGHRPGLKLINVPVLKHHDRGGSEMTASLKHLYGLLSMADGHARWRHYEGLGQTCGRMVASVRTPSLNIIDAVWVSHRSLRGHPVEATFNARQLLAGQDPVAVDYWAAKYILHPIDGDPRHHPGHPGITAWLTAARDKINRQGGLFNPELGVLAGMSTGNERRMRVFRRRL